MISATSFEIGTLNFINTINKEGRAFTYLRENVLRTSDAKIEEGLFVGLQIKKLL